MAKKKSKKENLDELSGIKIIKKALRSHEVKGIVIVMLSKDGEITIGAEGLDKFTCTNLLSQSATIMQEESGISSTLH